MELSYNYHCTRVRIALFVSLFLLLIHTNVALAIEPIGDSLLDNHLQSSIINDLQVGYSLHDANNTFWIQGTTDINVESIHVTCPSGYSFVVTDTETTDQFRYWRYTEVSQIDSWEKFGDGDYVITLGFPDQASQSTTISSMDNDGITRLAPLNIPSIINPEGLDGAVVFPAPDTPVTFTWADVDPNTDWIELKVESLDSSIDNYVLQYMGKTAFLTHCSGPLYFFEGLWEATIAAFSQRDFINMDGVPYSCVREAASSYKFQAFDGYDIEIAYIHEISFNAYVMSFIVNTDKSVTRVQVQCPSGRTVRITEYDINGNTINWDQEYISSSPHLSDYGNGDYVFTFSYSNGTSQSTTVPFTQADGITPIPDMIMQPILTSPSSLNGRTFYTNELTFVWDNIDPNANRIIFDREWNDGDDENFNYSDLFIFPHNRGPLETRSDSFIFDAGRWEVDIEAFHSVMGRNSDGFRYLVQKKIITDYEFYVQ